MKDLSIKETFEKDKKHHGLLDRKFKNIQE
jgi:hypothetical protein